ARRPRSPARRGCEFPVAQRLFHLDRRRHRPDPAQHHRRARAGAAEGARDRPHHSVPRGAGRLGHAERDGATRQAKSCAAFSNGIAIRGGRLLTSRAAAHPEDAGPCSAKGFFMRHIAFLPLAALMLSAGAAMAAPAPKPEAALKNKAYDAAVRILDRDHDRMVAEIIALTEIPAPSFKEAARAAAYREMLRDAGLTDIETDDEGNVMGVYRGTGPAGGPVVMIAAHLDTVFPEGTPIKVRR